MNYTTLQLFEPLNLTDPQKQALIFVREVGAIDNQTYRQMADCDTLKASTDLRTLKSHNLFASKGKGKATYYISGPGLNTEATDALSTRPPKISAPPHDLRDESDVADIEINTDISTPPLILSTPPHDLSTPAPSILIDESLQKEIDILNRREHDSDKIKGIIKEICKDRYLSARQISGILNKGEDYIKRKYLSEMIKSKDLVYLHAEMINHPEQAYKTNEN
jgi:ATP-dependent DNA helicase RecG